MLESTAIPKDLDTILRLVELLLIPILIRFNQKQEEQAKEINTIKTVLIGADGQNGMRSRVVMLERETKKTSLIVARHLGLESIREDKETED
jgi:hypothetical protein